MVAGKIRKWGNSMGVLISKKDLKDLGLHENEEVQMRVERRSNPLKEMFGAGKFSRPIDEILAEHRKNTSKHL